MPNFIKTVKTIQRFKVVADNLADAVKVDTAGLTPFFAPPPSVSAAEDRSTATKNPVRGGAPADPSPPVSP
ncbi:MAG: hypothetical protein WBD81_17845 [Collimonas pratensis]|uniref:hypothetical protein n=1 Tax=Collimonas pratensis TaxID=279113 RepID=UPI003C70BBE3